jgi:hypothetical protein
MRLKNLALGGLTAVAVLLCTSSQAHAVFQVRLTSGGTTIVITDNNTVASDGGGGDIGAGTAITGLITFSRTVGDYLVVGSMAESKPVLGSASNPTMDLSFQATRTNALLPVTTTNTVVIEGSDTGFTAGTPVVIVGTVGGTLAGDTKSVVYQNFFGNSSTNFDTSGGSSTTFTATTSPFAGSNSMTVTGATPFVLTQRITITPNDKGDLNVSGDAMLQTAPAPDALALLMSGVPFAGWLWMRRRKAQVAA